MKKDITKTLILSDIDGTFLDDNSNQVDANLQAIKKYTAAGGKFAFSTGRIQKSMPDVIPEWKELMNVPAIMCNGAYIYDSKNDALLHRLPLDKDYILPILYDLREKFPELQIRVTVYPCVTLVNRDLDAHVEINTEMHKVIVVGEKELVDEVKEYVYAKCGDNFAYSKSCDIFLEFLNPLATKGTQLDWLKEYLGGDITVYAIGDFDNDADMLRHADVPACPENGYKSIVNYCRENGLVVCDNNKGALADLIAHIME